MSGLHQRSPSSRTLEQSSFVGNDDWNIPQDPLKGGQGAKRNGLSKMLLLGGGLLLVLLLTTTRWIGSPSTTVEQLTCPEHVCPPLVCPEPTATAAPPPTEFEDLPMIIVPTSYNPPFWISIHHPNDDSPRASLLTTGKYYENADLLMMGNVIDMFPKGVMLDIGANIGIFSLFAASRGAPQVYSFEPNPKNVAKLKQSIRANKFESIITIIEAGASNVTGEARFSVPKGNSGMGRLTHDEMQPEKEHTDGFHTLVKMVRADAVVPEGTEVAFMKVDVEGNEVYAIRSASKLIEEGRVHVMIAEFTFSGGFETVGTREILEFMYANGYAVASHAGNEKVQPFGGELRTLEDVVASFANIGQATNFVFVKRESFEIAKAKLFPEGR